MLCLPFITSDKEVGCNEIKATKICFGKRVVKRCVPISDNPSFIHSSRQYKLYKDGQTTCAFCGVEATHVVQYKHHNEPQGVYGHIDLFHMRKRSVLLMTVDHILPVACGGGNQFSNFRMMCADCNVRRGHDITYDELKVVVDNPKLHVGISPQRMHKFVEFINSYARIKKPIVHKHLNDILSIVLFIMINEKKCMKKQLTKYIETSEMEIPNGYFFTGENRVPKIGELFYSEAPVFNMLNSWHKVADNVYYNSKQWEANCWIVIDINKWLDEHTVGKDIYEIIANLRKSVHETFEYHPFKIHGSLWKEFTDNHLNPYIAKLEKKVFNRIYDFGYGQKLYYSYFYFNEKANSYIK